MAYAAHKSSKKPGPNKKYNTVNKKSYVFNQYIKTGDKNDSYVQRLRLIILFIYFIFDIINSTQINYIK